MQLSLSLYIYIYVNHGELQQNILFKTPNRHG